MLTLPNGISFFRLLAGPSFSILFHKEFYSFCFIILWLAAISDWLDGWLARRMTGETKLGALLDAIADKTFFACVFITFYVKDLIPGWLLFVILARDTTILTLGFVTIVNKLNRNLDPIYLGKITTFLQFILALTLLDNLAFSFVGSLPNFALSTLIYVTGLLTLFSSSLYLKRFLQENYNSFKLK